MPKTDNRHMSRDFTGDISELDDQHLKNVLNLHLRSIATAGYENSLNRVWVLPPYLAEARKRNLKFPSKGAFPEIISRIDNEDWEWEFESLGRADAYEFEEFYGITSYVDL
jgi:hypothetical protein